MNKLQEEFKHFCNQEQDIILVHPKEILDWINQNYISKEQILNLECLKEELIFPLKDNLMTEFAKNTRNDLKLEIIGEIKKL